MTPQEHKYQRDLVVRSLLLADTPEDRHAVYARRPMKRRTGPVRHPPPRPVVPDGRTFVVPVVTERPL